jgi:hypothetical protein
MARERQTERRFFEARRRVVFVVLAWGILGLPETQQEVVAFAIAGRVAFYWRSVVAVRICGGAVFVHAVLSGDSTGQDVAIVPALRPAQDVPRDNSTRSREEAVE